MARIMLEPTAMELGLYADEYRDLVADLKYEGHGVEVLARPDQRSLGSDAFEVLDLAVRVFQFAGPVLDTEELIGRVRKRLHAPRPGRTARGLIYLPGDETHEFDFRLDD